THVRNVCVGQSLAWSMSKRRSGRGLALGSSEGTNLRRAIATLLQDTWLETPARYIHARTVQLLRPGRSQSNEGEILARLADQTNAPNTFVEFGFHWHEFNCIGLIREYSGLLIDGNGRTVRLARRLFPDNIRVEARYLTLENQCRGTVPDTGEPGLDRTILRWPPAWNSVHRRRRKRLLVSAEAPADAAGDSRSGVQRLLSAQADHGSVQA